MKPCTITPVRPIRDMHRIRSEFQAWTRFALAAVLVLTLSFGLVGCDSTTSPETAAQIDSIKATQPAPAVREFRMCSIGYAPEPSCSQCGNAGPYRWDVELRTSTGDTIVTESDSTTCKLLGSFPDTTRFQVDGFGAAGTVVERWIMVDGDSLGFRWEGRVNADSLRSTSWDNDR